MNYVLKKETFVEKLGKNMLEEKAKQYVPDGDTAKAKEACGIIEKIMSNKDCDSLTLEDILKAYTYQKVFEEIYEESSAVKHLKGFTPRFLSMKNHRGRRLL